MRCGKPVSRPANRAGRTQRFLLIFIKKYDIIYIESERKEMINMKVVRVKAKVSSPKLYTQEQMDSMSAELVSLRDQVMELKQKNAKLDTELDIERKNHALVLAGVQLWQRECEKLRQEVRTRDSRITLLEQCNRILKL